MYYRDKQSGKLFEFRKDMPPFLVALSDGTRAFIDLSERYEVAGKQEQYPDAITNIEKTDNPI